MAKSQCDFATPPSESHCDFVTAHLSHIVTLQPFHLGHTVIYDRNVHEQCKCHTGILVCCHLLSGGDGCAALTVPTCHGIGVTF